MKLSMKTAWAVSVGVLLLDAPDILAQYSFITNADKSIAITGYAGSAGALTIPGTIDGLSVTTIADSAFDFDTSLTSVTIPDSVTIIGTDAFQNCYNLTNVTIGAGVSSIGCGTFSPGGLKAINVSSNNTTFASVAGVLFDKGQRTLIEYPEAKPGNYTIPASVSGVGNSAFSGCFNLDNVTIPTNVLSIGEQAFFNCTSLGAIVIPESVTNIGVGAFAGCSSLLNLSVASGNLFYSTADGVLTDKSLKTLLAFPDGMNGEYIGSLGGLMGPGLYSVPNGITSIADYAFYYSKLTNVVIPDSVANIGNYAFYYSPGLTNLIVPNSVTNIGSNAFSLCFGLNSVTLGGGVVSIGSNAFYNCASLTNVTMTNSVISIGDDAFAECTYLTNLTIPDSVTTIGDSAFYDCPSLTSITIPNSVTTIGDGAFLGCSLKTFNVGAGNPAYSSVAGVLFNKSLATLVEYPENRIGRSYIVPNGVTSIGDNAFNGCTILANVTIPTGVAMIGDYAFSGGSVANVTLPTTITSIGNYAFYNSPLSAVKIPEGVASIGDDAFSATFLATVTVPDSVTNIGEDAFEGSGGLKAINVDSGDPAYSSLAGVLFNESLTTLIKYPEGRVGKSYSVPGGVATISDDAFANCSGLAVVTMPDSVASIGNGAFVNASVTNAFFQGNAPTADTSVFGGATNATAYYYSGATGWSSTFAGIPAVMLNSPIPTGSLQVTIAPIAAVNAGAQWQVDNGTPQNGGATMTNLAVGTHTLSFATVPGWNPPSSQTVTITNGARTKATGVYELAPPDKVPLFLGTNGGGAVAPNDNSKLLDVGKSYVLQAVPAKNWLFSNWVAGGGENFVSNGAILKFIMESNLTLTANFVTNIFLAVAGTYHGLFAPTNVSRGQMNSGSFQISVTGAGTVSGRLDLAGQTVSLPPQKLSLLGAATIISKRPLGESTLTTALQLDFADQSISGTVTDGSTFTAQLDGDLDVFSAAHKATGFSGAYTLIVPGTNDPAAGPYGVSYGTVNVSSLGAITFAGKLADGTSVSQSSVVSKDGYWPLYVSLYGGRGSLWGWNLFTNQTIVSAPVLNWINETNSSRTAVYRSGFTNQGATLTGQRYVPGGGLLGNFAVTLEAGNLPFAITNGVTITSSDKVVTDSVDDTNKLNLTINKATGVISGAFATPSDPKQTIKVGGVVLQGQTNAQGYFLGTNQSGAFLMQ